MKMSVFTRSVHSEQIFSNAPRGHVNRALWSERDPEVRGTFTAHSQHARHCELPPAQSSSAEHRSPASRLCEQLRSCMKCFRNESLNKCRWLFFTQIIYSGSGWLNMLTKHFWVVFFSSFCQNACKDPGVARRRVQTPLIHTTQADMGTENGDQRQDSLSGSHGRDRSRRGRVRYRAKWSSRQRYVRLWKTSLWF